MAKELTATNKRDAEILLAVLKLIKDNGGSMRHADIKTELPKIFTFADKEREPRKTWKEFWHSLLSMVGGIELKQVGIIDLKKGIWSITESGERHLNDTPEQFYEAYHIPYMELVKQRKAGNPTIENVIPTTSEDVAEFDVESLQSKARDGIRQYIIRKDPYQFQNLVAALLRGMGYYIPFIASKGKDGGIDIIAYEDPLGAKGNQVKVQVKHYPDTAVAIDVVKHLGYSVTKANEIGVIVTSGRFTNECHAESRRSTRPLRLLDIEELIDLWIQFYPRMTDEDKAELPMTPVYYLNNDKI